MTATVQAPSTSPVTDRGFRVFRFAVLGLCKVCLDPKFMFIGFLILTALHKSLKRKGYWGLRVKGLSTPIVVQVSISFVSLLRCFQLLPTQVPHFG